MKRFILYIMVLAAVLGLPAEGIDVGQLQPVELVSISKVRSEVVLETDTGDMGRGETVAEAFSDLKATTSGEVFLDTADYLLVKKGAEELVPELSAFLRKAVRLCWQEGETDLEAAAVYLRTHTPAATLKTFAKTGMMEVLRVNKGRMHLE